MLATILCLWYLALLVFDLFPLKLKPRYLSRLSLSLPSSQATTTQKLGSLSRKSGSYDVWSLAHPSPFSSALDVDFDESRGPAVGGEELLGMNVLLPRKKKGGKLYLGSSQIYPSITFLISSPSFSSIPSSTKCSSKANNPPPRPRGPARTPNSCRNARQLQSHPCLSNRR